MKSREMPLYMMRLSCGVIYEYSRGCRSTKKVYGKCRVKDITAFRIDTPKGNQLNRNKFATVISILTFVKVYLSLAQQNQIRGDQENTERGS